MAGGDLPLAMDCLPLHRLDEAHSAAWNVLMALLAHNGKYENPPFHEMGLCPNALHDLRLMAFGDLTATVLFPLPAVENTTTGKEQNTPYALVVMGQKGKTYL